jgi:hypothetical protein
MPVCIKNQGDFLLSALIFGKLTEVSILRQKIRFLILSYNDKLFTKNFAGLWSGSHFAGTRHWEREDKHLMCSLLNKVTLDFSPHLAYT